MTALAPAPVAVPDPEAHRQVAVVSRKAPIAFAVVTALFALLLLVAPREGDATFRFATVGDLFTIPDATVPGMGTAWVTVALMAVATVVAFGVGYAVIAWFLRYIATHRFTPFVAYRILAGVGLLALIGAGVLTPSS